MNIFDLPPELLTTCFSYLKGPDLANVSQTCSLFNGIASIEKLWQNRCLTEYGLPTDTELKDTYKKVYARVLHKYGRFIGLWRNSTTCYGGLIHIWYTQTGDILAEEFYGQRNVSDKFLRVPIFRIVLNETGNVDIEWLANSTNPQPCTLQGDQTDGKLLISTVVAKIETEDSAEEEKLLFLEDCYKRGIHPELCMYKWHSYRMNRGNNSYVRIETSRFEPVSKVPIQPGLFKGMYGGHGTEIVHLYYESEGADGIVGNAQKISGDPNVPSGKTSIRFYLNKHMFLNKEQQQLGSLSSDEDEETKFPFDPDKPCRQPFAIPSDVNLDNRHEICPKQCIGRFHGKGTVSPMGFRNPSLIGVHFVVFNPDLFGVLWMELCSFSLFSRAEETFEGLR